MSSPQSRKNTARAIFPFLDIIKSEREEEAAEKDPAKPQEDDDSNEVAIELSIFESPTARNTAARPSSAFDPDCTPALNGQTLPLAGGAEGGQMVEDVKSTKSCALSVVSKVSRKSASPIKPAKRRLPEGVRNKAADESRTLAEEKRYAGYCGKFLSRVHLSNT